METIHSYTSIEQSKVLAEILPLESADMWYWEWPTAPSYNNWNIRPMFHKGDDIVNIPCWSLAALIGVLPKGTNINTPSLINARYCCWNNYVAIDNINLVDACVNMIIKLHERKIL